MADRRAYGLSGAALAAAICLAPAPAAAQASEMLSLRERVTDGADRTYALVRCAAYHFSILEFVGTDRLGPEITQTSTYLMARLMTAAVALRMKENGTAQDPTMDAVDTEMRQISASYVSRYERNAAETGDPFGGDDVVSDDGAVCLALTRERTQ